MDLNDPTMQALLMQLLQNQNAIQNQNAPQIREQLQAIQQQVQAQAYQAQQNAQQRIVQPQATVRQSQMANQFQRQPPGQQQLLNHLITQQQLTQAAQAAQAQQYLGRSDLTTAMLLDAQRAQLAQQQVSQQQIAQQQIAQQQIAQQRAQHQRVQEELKALAKTFPEVVKILNSPEMADKTPEYRLNYIKQIVSQRRQSVPTKNQSINLISQHGPQISQKFSQQHAQQSPPTQASPPMNPLEQRSANDIVKMLQFAQGLTPDLKRSQQPVDQRHLIAQFLLQQQQQLQKQQYQQQQQQQQQQQHQNQHQNQHQQQKAESPQGKPAQANRTQEEKQMEKRLRDPAYVANLLQNHTDQIQAVVKNQVLHATLKHTIDTNPHLKQLIKARREAHTTTPPQVKPETPLALKGHAEPSIPTLAAAHATALLQPLLEAKKQPPTLEWLEELDRIVFLGQDEELDFDPAVTDLGGPEESSFLAEASRLLHA